MKIIHKGYKSCVGAWIPCKKTAFLNITYNYLWNKVNCKECLKIKNKSTRWILAYRKLKTSGCL